MSERRLIVDRIKLVNRTIGCAMLVGLAVVVTVAYMRWNAPAPEPFKDVEPKLTGVFKFEPRADITAYELALALETMLGTPFALERTKPWIDAMPPSARRHWRWVPPAVQSPPAPQEAPQRPQ